MRRPDPLPIAAAALPLAVYVATLHPGLPAGDSGELITVASQLGVAHPPGYPLYTWLGHGFIEAVPWGAVAWRMNLLSALLAAAAAGVLARAVARWTGSGASGLVAAWTFAFFPTVWKYALVAEVFALNALMACGLFACVVRISADARAEASRPAWPLAVLLALSVLMVSHHHSLVLLAAPSALVVAAAWWPSAALRGALGLPRAPYVLDRRRLGWASLVAVLALLPLLHLPWAAGREARLVWGDPDHLAGLLRHLTRAAYGSFTLAPEHLGLAADTYHGWLYLASLRDGIGWIGLLLALAGVGWTLAAPARRAPALALLGLLAAQLWFFTNVGYPSEPPIYRGVVERFYILPQVAVAAFVGAGTALALSRLPAALGPALPVVVVTVLLGLHLRDVDQRGNRTAEDLVRAVLASVPERGVLFSRGDLFHNGLAYLQAVEGLRPDVVVVDQALMNAPWYARRLDDRHPGLLGEIAAPSTLRWVESLGERPACFLGLAERSVEERYVLVPRGLVQCAFPKSAPPTNLDRVLADLALWRELRWESWFRPQDPRSFETAERGRLAELAARTAIELCQRDASAVLVTGPGLTALDAFLRRHRELPAPDPRLLWADGMLRVYQPALRDPGLAAQLFRMQLALEPEGERADEARRLLPRLDAVLAQ